jgi:hypothetical protein
MTPSDLVARAHAHNLQVWYLFAFLTLVWSCHMHEVVRTSCADFLCIH